MKQWTALLALLCAGCGSQGSLDIDVGDPLGRRFKVASERGLEYDPATLAYYFIYEEKGAFVGFNAADAPSFGPIEVWEVTLEDVWEGSSVEATVDTLRWEGGDHPWSMSGTLSGAVSDGSGEASFDGTFSVRSMDCDGQLGLTGWCGNLSFSDATDFVYYASYPGDGFYGDGGELPEALASLFYAPEDVSDGVYHATMEGGRLVFPGGAELDCEAFPSDRGPEDGDQDVICGAELGALEIDGCEHTVVVSASPGWFMALTTHPDASCGADPYGYAASLVGSTALEQ